MAFVAFGAEALGAVEAGGEAEVGTEVGEAADTISETPQDVGGGHSIKVSEEQVRAMLWSDAVIDAITKRAEDICDAANSMAITKGAVYEVTVPTLGAVTRPRANIWTKNYKAVIDDHYHATLLKAAAKFPSDPKPEGAGEVSDEELETDEGTGEPDEGAEAGEEAAAGEAAEGGELAEIAEVAAIAAI